ncbi:MAG: winged helix-turn-helix transcriptional regulator [Caldiserica bacterium]|nr:winged helix-turn-helix transcriptional regulator [Caldisericota bacterium]
MTNKNTSKILEFLLRNITQSYNINQIAKELKISVGGAHKILKSLEQDNILTSIKLGNAIFYRLNLDSKETQKICELILLESKNRVLKNNPAAKIYAEDLKEVESFSEAMILFGSILVKGKEARDVDVLFIVKSSQIKKVEDFCLRISSLRPKKVVPLLMSKNDFRNNLKKRDTVVVDILKTGVILSGEETIVKILKEV